MNPKFKTVTLFGATGRSGQPILRNLLNGGYRVKVLVRTPAKLNLEHKNLEVFTGDVGDADDVNRAITGTDAVISTIGQVKGSPPDIQTQGTKHMLAAMTKHGIKRIISLTGAGIPHPKDKPKFADKFIRKVMNTFFKEVISDGTAHAELLRNSKKDYTIVRGPRLTENAAKGTRKVGYVGDISSSMTRADLADFIIEILYKELYLRDEPAVSN